jgi:hypothetical protein
MSEQPVRKSDLIEGDPIGEISKDLEQGLKDLEKYDEALKDIAKTMSGDLKTGMTDTLKGIEAINAAEKRSAEQLEKKKVTEQSINTLEKQRVTVRNNRIKAMDNFEKKLKKEAAAEAKLAAARRKARDPLKRLVRLTKEARENTQRLTITQGKNSKATKIAQKRYEALDNKLKQVRDTTKNGRKSLTQLIATNNKLGLSFRKLTSLAGQFGLALGGATLVRGTISMLAEFDEKVADVAKTTGLTAKGAKELSQELLKIDTRTSITELQELASAAGRLGITGKKDLIGFATAADKVFVALGDDLEGTAEEIATNLGKISSLFGLEQEFGIEEGIERVGSGLNELSAKSKASAGAISNFTTRMAGLSSVLELQDVQALGALFDETGQSAEVASSTMIKLLPELSKDFKRFAKVAGVAPKLFKEIAEESPIEALKLVAEGAKNNEKGLFNLNAVLKSYGVESARASGIVSVLTNNVGRLTELQEISKTAMAENTSITNEFNTKNDTLAATYEKAVNKIKAFILGSEGATAVSEKLKDMLRFVANNITTIFKVLGKLIKLYVIFKTTMLALKLKEQIANFKELGKSAEGAGEGLTKGATSAKAFGTALKGIGISLAIGLLLELAAAFADVVFFADAARKEAEKFRDQNDKAEKDAIATATKRTEALEENIKALQDELDLNLEAEKNAEKRKQLQEEFLANELLLVKATQGKVNADIIAENKSKNALIARKRALEEIQAIIENSDESIPGFVAPDFTKEQKSVLESIGVDPDSSIEANQALSQVSGSLRTIQNEIVSTNKKITVFKGELKEISGGVSDVEQKTKLLGKTVVGQAEKQISLLRRIKDEQLKQIEDVDARQIATAEEKNKRAIEDLNLTNAIESEKARLTIELNKNLEIELTNIRREAREREKEARLRAEKQAFDERKQFEVEQIESANEAILASEVELVAITGEINTEAFEKRLEEEKKLREAIIERQFLEALGASTNAEEQILATQQRDQALLLLDQEFNRKKAEGFDALNDAQEEFNAEQEESLKEQLEIANQIQQAITDALSKQIDKRIELAQKEVDAAKSNQEFFKQLAINGNIEAKESIKEQIQFEKEAQREKERLEKRKAQLAIANAALKAFENELAEGSTPLEALAAATLTSGIMTGILADILFFEKGTDNAPEGLAVVDEKGAEIITDRKGNIKSLGTDGGARTTFLKSGDKVYTAAKTANIMSGLEGVSRAQKMSTKIDSAGNSFDLVGMNRVITGAFKSAVREMPHSTTKWQGMVNGMAKIATDTARGNDTERTNTWIS